MQLLSAFLLVAQNSYVCQKDITHSIKLKQWNWQCDNEYSATCTVLAIELLDVIASLTVDYLDGLMRPLGLDELPAGP